MKGFIDKIKGWLDNRKAEQAARVRRDREEQNYAAGNGYRRYADALREMRNMPDNVSFKSNPVLHLALKALGGNPYKIELLDRMNRMDPDKFNFAIWKKKGPWQYTFDEIYGNNLNSSNKR